MEAAVRKAQGDADKYLRQLQTTIHAKPLAIDLKIVNAGSGSLNEISKRMRDIVTDWNNVSEAERMASKTSGEYTDRAKKLIAEFARLTSASEAYARSLQQIVAASRRVANEAGESNGKTAQNAGYSIGKREVNNQHQLYASSQAMFFSLQK